jgi:hypothetical protein
MQIYSHVLNLRISHPNLDPQLVSEKLGLAAQTAWRSGDPRQTPKGTPLGGNRSQGYWSADPFSYGWRDSADALVEDALEELVSFLQPHRDFLLGYTDDGSVRIWVSTQSIRNFAIELPPTMLTQLGSLGVSLVHDVYQGS